MSSQPRRRGRPAQLSREKILDATLQLLQEVPLSGFTMQRLARALHTAPMTLYGYFESREALLDASVEKILGGLRPITSSPDWRQTVRDWANALRARMLDYPQSVQLMNSRTRIPAAWLELTAPLVEALRHAGLQGFLLAETVRWISRMVIGAILTEITLHEDSLLRERIDVSEQLERLSPTSRDEIMHLAPFLNLPDNDALFAFTLDRLVDAVEFLAARQPAGATHQNPADAC